MSTAPPDTSRLRLCKYCQKLKPEASFEVCRIIRGKAYRRLRCQQCKRNKTNERRAALRSWLDDYKKSLRCERCGFADYRALTFHHRCSSEKEFNVADMIRVGFSRATIKREIAKCIVLCCNCHQIEHYDKWK